MTRFEWFDKGYGQMAMELGIISPSMFYRFIQYKVYQELRASGLSQGQAIFEVSEKFRVSESTIFRAVSFFRND